MVKTYLIAVLLWFGFGLAQAAEITSYLTSKKVPLNESFQLVFEAKGDLDDEPDWQPLEKNFEIISNSRSQQISIINGSSSRSVRWQLTLMAKRIGLLMVPSIAFGRDDSPAQVVEVSQPSQQQAGTTNANVFVELVADKKQVYLQQQVLLTVKLWRRVNLSSATLSEPTLSGVDAVIERLGEDREFEQFRQGQRYKIIERRYALFPQQSGQMQIEPITFQGSVVERRGFFDPFSGAGKQIVKRSNALTLEVKGIPAQAQGLAWLPSQQVQLLESWPQTSVTMRVGESLTRTVAVMAEGLTAAQLPDLEMSLPEGLRAYPDQPILKDQQSESGITGLRQQKLALVAQKVGEYRLPAIELQWWNNDSQRLQVARLPERLIQVVAAKGEISASEKTQEADTALMPSAETVQAVPLKVAKKRDSVWFWLSLFLAFGWLVTLILCCLRRGKVDRSQCSKKVPTNTRQLLKKVQKAAINNQAQECKTLLLQWAKLRWLQRSSGSLTAVAERLPDPLKGAVLELNCALYQGNVAWQGVTLQQALKTFVMEKKSAKKESSTLSPLYPTE